MKANQYNDALNNTNLNPKRSLIQDSFDLSKLQMKS